MNLYRAIYSTTGDRSRHMTFAARDYKEAQRIASEWELSDDRLWAVQSLRPLQDSFKLDSLTH